MVWIGQGTCQNLDEMSDVLTLAISCHQHLKSETPIVDREQYTNGLKLTLLWLSLKWILADKCIDTSVTNNAGRVLLTMHE